MTLRGSRAVAADDAVEIYSRPKNTIVRIAQKRVTEMQAELGPQLKR
jgi:hypothetical protein